MNQKYRAPVPPAYLGLYNFQLVEIIALGSATAPNNATKIQFVDQPYLRDKRIVTLEMYSSTDMPFSPTGGAVATAAQLANLTLTLYSDNPDKPGIMGEWYQNIPYPDLHRIQNATPEPFVRDRYALSGPIVSWDKCYYTLGAAMGSVANVSFLLGVGFVDNITEDQGTGY